MKLITTDFTEVKVFVEKESDLYDRFDPEEDMISADVMSYILDRYGEEALAKKARIVFVCGEDIDEERARASFRSRVETLQTVNRRERKVNRLDMTRLYVIGGIIIAAGIVLKAFMDEFPMEIVSIVGTFAVWEASSILLTKNPRNTVAKKRLETLANAELVFERK